MSTVAAMVPENVPAAFAAWDDMFEVCAGSSQLTASVDTFEVSIESSQSIAGVDTFDVSIRSTPCVDATGMVSAAAALREEAGTTHTVTLLTLQSSSSNLSNLENAS